MGKSDKLTVRKRIDDMIGLILAGALWHEIRHYASEQGWSVSERQLRRYQEWAYEQLNVTLDRDREKNITRHLCQRRALYSRAMSVSDFRTALSVAKDEAELLGLYPAARHEVTGADGGPLQTLSATIEVTDAERDIAIRSLMARLGKGDPGSAVDGQGDGL